MPPPRHVLGLSAFYHDSAAALLRDGKIIAAAQEERFTRVKNESEFPTQAIQYCLCQGGLTAAELDCVVFYDKPVLKFRRLLETYLAVAPGGWRTFPSVMANWLGGKLGLRKTIREEMPGLRADCPILFTAHHQALAASAFYPSPFPEAAILTIDDGEWATTTIGRGAGNKIELLYELRFPHSLGMLYSAFMDYCGFRINSGEHKLMDLAPHGEPLYAEVILREVLDLKEDGSFWLNLEYFDFLRGTTMTNGRFHRLFGGPPRQPEETIEQRHMDLARSIQVVTEEIVLRMAKHARAVTGEKNLCLAGGVALNYVANGRLLRERLFDNIGMQPAAGDAGGALGAALAAWHAEGPPVSPKGRGEPLACTPENAFRCFSRTDMDSFTLGNFLLEREEQPAAPDWRVTPRAHVKFKEDPKEWRKSVWMSAGGLAVLSTLLRWRHVVHWLPWLMVLLALAGVSWAADKRPKKFRGYYRWSMRAAFYLKQIGGRFLLAIFFFCILTPLGLVLRGIGRDALFLQRPLGRDSYWTKVRAASSLERLF